MVPRGYRFIKPASAADLFWQRPLNKLNIRCPGCQRNGPITAQVIRRNLVGGATESQFAAVPDRLREPVSYRVWTRYLSMDWGKVYEDSHGHGRFEGAVIL
jgi:hypothetical protein